MWLNERRCCYLIPKKEIQGVFQMRGLTVMVVVLLLLGGCSFSAPGVHARIGEPAHIYIDGGHGGHGGFCPPGQRMKGNC